MSFLENGNADAVFFCSDEKLNIFLIGDSIRLGYEDTLKKELSDVAHIISPAENCCNSQNIITGLNFWSNMIDFPDKIDTVHFNCGHWDVAHWLGYKTSLTSESEYEKNIQMIIDLIRIIFPNSKIVFATTTPINPQNLSGTNARSNDEIDRYNAIAVKVANENGVLVNDLNSYAKGFDSNNYVDYCHYTKKACELLGKAVADYIKEVYYKN